MKFNVKQTFGFVSTSLTATTVEFAIYTLINFLLEDIMPFFHIVISSCLSRCVSELVKFELDKNAVFKSKDSSIVRYVIFAVVRGIISASIISTIFYITSGNRTLIKMVVDVCLFVPSFFISKSWIHHS